MVELLKQPQFKPMHVVDQIMAIFVGAKGFLDKVPQKQVAAWEEQFLRYMREQKPTVRATLMKDRKFSPAIEQQLVAAIQEFQPQFKASGAGQV
jgi:F-type H+-transporting ATPase subunit alpha